MITRDAELRAISRSCSPSPRRVYWYHVYGHDRLDRDADGTSLAAAVSLRPWTDPEAALCPAMLAGQPPTIGPRYEAVRSVMGAWPALTGLILC